MCDTESRGVPGGFDDMKSSKAVDIMTMVNYKMGGMSTVRTEMDGTILCSGGD